MEISKDEAAMNCLVVKSMMAIGYRTDDMDMVYAVGPMGMYMKANGSTIYLMVWDA